MPINPQLSAIARFRNRLDRQSTADLKRLISAYGQMSQRLKDKIDLLLLEMGRNPAANITSTQRYKDLIRALTEEYTRYAAYLGTELERIAAEARSQARLDSAALIAAALVARGLTVRPQTIPQTTVPLSVLAPGSDAARRLAELAPLQAQRIIDRLTEGIRSGMGFERLGRLIVDDLGLGLADALRWARTIQMESYRETSHNTMLENSAYIDGWTWWAQLDERTCEGCSEGHGTFHTSDESLNDITPHIWNCRCCALPHVVGDVNPVSGEPVESE